MYNISFSLQHMTVGLLIKSERELVNLESISIKRKLLFIVKYNLHVLYYKFIINYTLAVTIGVILITINYLSVF